MAISPHQRIFYFASRAVYPNWFSVAYFTEGWLFFFREEYYNLAVLITIVSLVQLILYLLLGINIMYVLISWGLVILIRRFLAGGICTSSKKLSGQTVIITGGNTGIGKETARDLLRRGAHIILACRTPSKAEDARRELAREGGTIETRQLDLSSLQSVRDFAEGIKKDNIRVHILINNAGVMMCPYTETADGFELQMGTNHLGHFLLTNLLLPQLKHDEPARIINLSSIAHTFNDLDFDDFFMKKNYNKQTVYGNTKVANILFTRLLASKLKGTNIQVFSVHPGHVYSELLRHVMSDVVNNLFIRLLYKTTMEGAQTTIHCATEAVQHPAMYFSDCAVGWPTPMATDDVVAEKLWKLSAKLVNLKE